MKRLGSKCIGRSPVHQILCALLVFAIATRVAEVQTAHAAPSDLVPFFEPVKNKVAARRNKTKHSAKRQSARRSAEMLVRIKNIRKKLHGKKAFTLTLKDRTYLLDPKSLDKLTLDKIESVSGMLGMQGESEFGGDISFALKRSGGKVAGRIGLTEGAIYSLASTSTKDTFLLARVGAEQAPVVLDLKLVRFDHKEMAEKLPLVKGDSSPQSIQRAQQSIISSHKAELVYNISPDLALVRTNSSTRAFNGEFVVEYPVHVGQFAARPNDKEFPRQWGLDNNGQDVDGEAGDLDVDIDAPEAWESGTGSSQVVVAVVDTGVNYQHSDLTHNMWSNPQDPRDGNDNDGNGYSDDTLGWDFSICDYWNFNLPGTNDAFCQPGRERDEDGNPNDESGHGTRIAGIIGAEGNNSLGVSGVNWSVTLLPIKVGSTNFYLTDAEFLKAVRYAIDLRTKRGVNIRVLNASFGFERTCTPEIAEVVAAAEKAGILIVAASGNRQRELKSATHFIPAECSGETSNGTPINNILTVAAIDQKGALWKSAASGTNFGRSSVDVAAPGFQIVSTSYDGAYTKGSGSSLAAAHASGAAALIFSKYPALTPKEMRDLLVSTSKPPPHCGPAPNVCEDTRAGSFGGGIISLRRALQALEGSNPRPTTTPTPTVTQPTPPTPTATRIPTATRQPTFTPTPRPTHIPTLSVTASPSPTSYGAATPTRTPLSIPATITPTRTPLSAATSTPTRTPISIPATATPTRTPVSLPPTSTPTHTPPSLATSTPTRTPINIPATSTPTKTPLNAPPTSTPTRTPNSTPTIIGFPPVATATPTSKPTLPGQDGCPSGMKRAIGEPFCRPTNYVGGSCVPESTRIEMGCTANYPNPSCFCTIT